LATVAVAGTLTVNATAPKLAAGSPWIVRICWIEFVAAALPGTIGFVADGAAGAVVPNVSVAVSPPNANAGVAINPTPARANPPTVTAATPARSNLLRTVIPLLR